MRAMMLLNANEGLSGSQILAAFNVSRPYVERWAGDSWKADQNEHETKIHAQGWSSGGPIGGDGM